MQPRGALMSRENDLYPTPMSIITAILDHWQPPRQVWEPCAGDGRFARALVKAGALGTYQEDLTTGSDFFSHHRARLPTLVTNPPFGKIRQFIDHAFAIGVKKMVLVCPERLWACQKGAEQFNRRRPSVWANLSWREDYLGKGGSPDRALAVAIWNQPRSTMCDFQVWEKPVETSKFEGAA